MKAVAKGVGGCDDRVSKRRSIPIWTEPARNMATSIRMKRAIREGRVHYPLGENVSGLLVYDGGGNMSAHVARNDRP